METTLTETNIEIYAKKARVGAMALVRYHLAKITEFVNSGEDVGDGFARYHESAMIADRDFGVPTVYHDQVCSELAAWYNESRRNRR